VAGNTCIPSFVYSFHSFIRTFIPEVTVTTDLTYLEYIVSLLVCICVSILIVDLVQGLRCLSETSLLYLFNFAFQKHILECLFELFHLQLPVWTADFTEALFSSGTCLDESLLVVTYIHTFFSVR